MRYEIEWHFFESLDCHELLHGSEKKDLLSELSSANGKLSLDTFIQKIIIVDNEKIELDYPDKSIILNI